MIRATVVPVWIEVDQPDFWISKKNFQTCKNLYIHVQSQQRAVLVVSQILASSFQRGRHTKLHIIV